MKIKRYVAANMRQALRDVRNEQGADAVILSNRRVGDGIEVVAAVDYDETLLQRTVAPPPPSAARGDSEHETESDRVEPRPQATGADAVSPPESAVARLREDVWARDGEIMEMRQEMQDMRTLLQDQLASLAWNDQVRRDPATVCWLRHFAAIGLDADIARLVAGRAAGLKGSADYIAAASQALAASLPMADDRLIDEGGIVAVVGPTGVGKTTSIAKIAARFALRHGRENVALVSTDSFRIGAQEQLATFAQILDVPVHMVGEPGELTRVLATLSHKRLVLIDTAGISQRDAGLAGRLKDLHAGPVKASVYLALAANGQKSALDEAVRAFSQVTLDGCILTKVDEAGSLGGAMTAIIRHELPLAYMANGQRVPEDMHVASSKRSWFVHYATRLAGQSRQSIGEDYMARNFGEVRTHAFA